MLPRTSRRAFFDAIGGKLRTSGTGVHCSGPRRAMKARVPQEPGVLLEVSRRRHHNRPRHATVDICANCSVANMGRPERTAATMTAARPLRGKVAIVTGGGFNVGRGVATAFAAAGAHVVVASRDEERLQATVAAITAEGGSARAMRTDVTDLTQVEALVAFTERTFGAVDAMAAIAGGGCSYEPFDRMRPDAWDATFRTTSPRRS